MTAAVKANLADSILKKMDGTKPGFQAEGFSWDEYIKHRIAYPSSFYERIYNHHAKHSSSWDAAHDVGAGPGIVSEKLASQFNHVHVSDPGPDYVDIASHRLSSLGFPADKFTFRAEGAEKSEVPDKSMDLVIIAEAIHWCDIPVAMREFARELKPGGTVAVTFYGLPTLSIPEADEKFHSLLQSLVHVSRKVGGVYERAMKQMTNGLNSLEFEKDLWDDVKRVWINTNGDPRKLTLAPKGMYESVDRRQKDEEMVYVEEDYSWSKQGDLPALRGLLKSIVITASDADIDSFWPEMEEACGGKDAQFKMTWSVVMLLATKR